MKHLSGLIASAAVLLAVQVYAQGCGAAAACSAAAAAEAKAAEPGILNPAGLDALLKAKVSVTVLDARSGKYDDGRRIPGAKSLNSTSSAEEIAKVIPSKESLVVTYCSNLKCPASARLAKHLAGLGYSNILELPQGIDGWAAEGRPVEKVN